MSKDKFSPTRTRVGKGNAFESRFDPDNYKRSGRPGMPGTGDVDTAARNADMAKAAATDEWMSKPVGYYGNDYYTKRQQYLHDKKKKKAMKDGSYEYKDNANGALEKLYDAGIGYDSAVAYGSARGIKVINSLSDAEAIIDQMGRAQGDYTDAAIKKAGIGNKKDSADTTPPKPTGPIEYSGALSSAQEAVSKAEGFVNSDEAGGQGSADPEKRAVSREFLNKYRMDFTNQSRNQDGR